jgi:hypothetical protein
MTVSITPRFELVRWSSDEDELTRVQLDTSHSNIDQTAAKFLVGSGVPNFTPAAVYVGAFYYDVTAFILYFYTGSVTTSGEFTAGNWEKINEMATTVTSMSAGSTSTVGTSRLAARADHVHALSRGTTNPQPIGTTAAIGSSGNVSDAGHVHVLEAGSVNADSILANNVVITAKIANDAVTADKLADSASVDSSRAVTSDHIRNSAVTTVKINNSAVTADKVADASLTKSKINTSISGGPGVYHNGMGSTGGAITYGTAAPSGSANEGDIYLQHLA